MTPDSSPEPQTAPAEIPEVESPAQPAASGSATFVPPVVEEVDLNHLYPDAEQDLNDLFPEKELRDLLKQVHKSKQDISRINTRFIEDPEHVVPQINEEEE